jgi:hypothetical protein
MPLPSARPGEGTGPGLDVQDHALFAIAADPYPVAGGHNMPLVGGEGFQKASGHAADHPPLGVLYKAGQTVNLKHPATPGGLKCRSDGEPVGVFCREFVCHDCATTGEGSFARKSLTRGKFIRVIAIRRSKIREISFPLPS